MHKPFASLFAVLCLVGCGTKPVPQAGSNDDSKGAPRAELRIGDGSDEASHLSFAITSVSEHQKLSVEAPYQIDGGEWTFFDCQANSDPKVVFTVGTASKSGDGNVPSAWGKAVLIVKDREAGARFVELFSKASSGKLPASNNQPYVPKPLPINTAILGCNMDRGHEGGFSGTAGAGPQQNGSRNTMGNLAKSISTMTWSNPPGRVQRERRRLCRRLGGNICRRSARRASARTYAR